MLILTRKPGQKIIIDGGITVQVLGVTGNTVRLGIEAPAGTAVDRSEIHERKLKEATDAIA